MTGIIVPGPPQVLLAAGMSSPTLRHVALKGINIDQVANPQVTVSFLVLVPLNLTLCPSLLNVF